MWRLTLGTLAVLLATVATAQAAELEKAVVTTERTIVPFSTVVGDNPCTGEPVALEGELLVITHTTENATGGFNANIFLIPRGVTGHGLLTGADYLFVGPTHSTFTLSELPQNEVTDTFSSVLVSPGGGGNLLVQGTFHETVNANGEVTALVENVGASCVG
jgi:hypothetical protein